MLIKFKKPDPRDGMIVRMDSSRGQHFIDIGHASQVPESATTAATDVVAGPVPAVHSAADLAAAEQFVDGTIDDVKARIEGADRESLHAAMDAEQAKGDKARKGVIDAITAAIAALESSSS